MNGEKKEARYIDLFGGIGGFRLGIERANNQSGKTGKAPTGYRVSPKGSDGILASGNSRLDSASNKNTCGFRCVWYNDIDRYATQIYNKNFQESYEPIDIREVDAKEIPDHDIVCAGFPCQSFSIAGKREGLEDARGTLFFEICRIAGAKRPEMLLLENVKGLLSHDEGETFRVVLESLRELGYDVEWQVLNSKDFGVPQNRERVFIVGHLGGLGGREVFPLEGTMPKNDAEIAIKGDKRKWSQIYRIYDIDGIAPSLITPTGGHHIPKIKQIGTLDRKGHDISNRVFDSNGLSKTLCGQGGGAEEKTGLYAVLTPDKERKRQHGRRMKGDGEPMFTLTGQDVHGVAILDDYNQRIKDNGIVPAVRRTNANKSLRNASKIILGNIYPSKGEAGAVHHKDGIFSTVKQGKRGGKTGVPPIYDGIRIRRLTPIECERLQGFPDGWTEGVSDTQRYKMLGNAVTVNVIEAIARRMMELGI